SVFSVLSFADFFSRSPFSAAWFPSKRFHFSRYSRISTLVSSSWANAVLAKSKPNVAAVIKRFIWLLLFFVLPNKKARAPPNCWRSTGLWVRDLWPLGIFNYASLARSTRYLLRHSLLQR